MARLLVKNIGLLQTAVGFGPAAGAEQRNNLKIRNCAVLIEDGIIDSIIPEGEPLPECPSVDAEGRLVTAGLVDCHTHLVFGGWRQNEIPLKLAGAGYLDILRAGGGILSTVRATRAATEDELFTRSMGFLDEMLSLGVTTCEIKSGYGLDLENELKQLRVIGRLDREHKMTVVPTFMAAHAIPPEFSGNGDGYIDHICSKILPEVAEKKLARFCDIFCEDEVFDVPQSRKMLLAAKEKGFGLKIHADEIEEIGGAVLAGELGAVSAEHLIATGEKGMHSMAAGGTIAALLPSTSFYLGKTFAPARRMIELGIPVAIASDFNPGSCPSLNLQLCMTIACSRYRMTPEEVLTAVTLNAAQAIGETKSGVVAPGMNGDLVIWNAPDVETLCYRFGSNMAATVIKKGEIC